MIYISEIFEKEEKINNGKFPQIFIKYTNNSSTKNHNLWHKKSLDILIAGYTQQKANLKD